MKNINSQVLRKTFAFSHVRFTLVRFTLVRFVLSAILIPALLIGSAFTFGGSKLQAQANGSPNGQSSKQGFFAGFVYLNGFKVDTTKLVTTNITTITDATTTGYRIAVDRPDGGYVTISSIDATGGNPYWTGGSTGAIATGIRTLVEANCERGETSVDTGEVGNPKEYFFSLLYFNSFDSGEKQDLANTVTPADASDNLFSVGTMEEKSYCYRYFFGDLSSDRTSIPDYQIATPDSVLTPTSVHAVPRTTTSKSDKLSGIGLQFGFRWEKWRASLTHFTGKGGDNDLANTLVMADYFFNEDFFVGGGLASMKLTNSANGSTSASTTSPAIQIGYKRNLTPNLSLNFGLTKYISGVSLKSSVTTNNTAANTTTPIVLDSFEKTKTVRGDSATLGHQKVGVPSGVTSFYYEGLDSDRRIEVTQVLSRTVYINKFQIPAGASETQTTTTTETNAELKAPLVISISFHLSF